MSRFAKRDDDDSVGDLERSSEDSQVFELPLNQVEGRRSAQMEDVEILREENSEYYADLAVSEYFQSLPQTYPPLIKSFRRILRNLESS